MTNVFDFTEPFSVRPVKAMALSLSDRFFLTLTPFSSLLYTSGVFVSSSYPKWKNRLTGVWRIILLILCVQSNVYITIKRTTILYNFSSLLESSDGIVDDITNAMVRLSALVCDTVVHCELFFTAWPMVKSFLEVLEIVDHDLKRPSLSRMRILSFIGLAYTLLTVSFKN